MGLVIKQASPFFSALGAPCSISLGSCAVAGLDLGQNSAILLLMNGAWESHGESPLVQR